jgi:hypothetical protein
MSRFSFYSEKSSLSISFRTYSSKREFETMYIYVKIKNSIESATALGDASRHKPDRYAAISLMASATPLMRPSLGLYRYSFVQNI